jgi:hypothetical protein
MKALKESIEWLIENQDGLEKENNIYPQWNQGYREALQDVLLLMTLPEGTSLEKSIKYLIMWSKK